MSRRRRLEGNYYDYDVALIILDEPLKVNGSKYDFINTIYSGPNSALENHTLPCYGYSKNPADEEDLNQDFFLDTHPDEDQNGNGKLDTLRDPFHVLLNGVLPSGIQARYIDDWYVYHLNQGEVHCSSNEKRVPYTEGWWNHVHLLP